MSFSTRHAGESSSSSPPPCRQFTFSEMKLATGNFDELHEIGSGGSCKVYRGTITCGEIGLDVAIKRLNTGSEREAVQFSAEIEVLSNIRHNNVVSLIGYCHDGIELIVVYELMSHGTLEDHLRGNLDPLTWEQRLKILIGAAQGLDYIHSYRKKKLSVINGDVKSSNILLDENWTAKISDFGLSRASLTNQPSTSENNVSGTFGYIDPAIPKTLRQTRKSDVYSFGVVLFEVLSGKHPVDRSNDEEHVALARWAKDIVKEGRLEQIVDPNLRGKISEICLKKFAQIAVKCLRSDPEKRPRMVKVVKDLFSLLPSQQNTWVPKMLLPSNWKNLVRGTSLNSMERYLYNVVGEHRTLQQFDFSTVDSATKNFSEANKLSSDADKSIYKGRLQNGQGIAVTRYCNASTYLACRIEASALANLEHENVMQLLGYCINKTSVYLLYDVEPSATLDSLLFDPLCYLLDWDKRCKIILGIARALVYLHHHAPMRITNPDLKPANILLDESFDPILSGFASSKPVRYIEVNSVCTCVSRGYLCPTCCWETGTRVDAQSFGELVLETVTGQQPFDQERYAKYIYNDYELFEYVKRNWLEGTLSDISDPRIDVDSALMKKYIEIGLLCAQRNPAVRPTMETVVDMLLDTLSLTDPVLEMRARMSPGRESFRR